MFNRLLYWNRIISAYLFPTTSQLSFWHGIPEINYVPNLDYPIPYYMKFHYKANFSGDTDEKGIPLLNYRGNIGLQYNPIAIAQFGLGNYNLYLDTNENSRRIKFITAADWLVKNLELNKYGIPVWQHHFDFEYRNKLKSPWYSGLAQGLGISVLLRAYNETKEEKYFEAYKKASISMKKKIDEGGVLFIDSEGNHWIEEYIVNPPTHILNGFIWSLWGVYDSWKYLDDQFSKKLFFDCLETIKKNLNNYDIGYWSLYEQSGTYFPMIASPFYHKLHIVQLKILYSLSSISFFNDKASQWEAYSDSWINRKRAFFGKAFFKVFYY